MSGATHVVVSGVQQTQEFGGGPGCENSKQGQISKGIGDRLRIDNGNIPQYLVMLAEQRKTDIADCPDLRQVRVLWKEIDHLIGNVQVCFFPEQFFTGRSLNVVFIMIDKLTAKPERQ